MLRSQRWAFGRPAVVNVPAGNVDAMPFKCTKCMGAKPAGDLMYWKGQPRMVGPSPYVVPVNLTDEPIWPVMPDLPTPADARPSSRTGAGDMFASRTNLKTPNTGYWVGVPSYVDMTQQIRTARQVYNQLSRGWTVTPRIVRRTGFGHVNDAVYQFLRLNGVPLASFERWQPVMLETEQGAFLELGDPETGGRFWIQYRPGMDAWASKYVAEAMLRAYLMDRG